MAKLADIKCGMNTQAYVLLQVMSQMDVDGLDSWAMSTAPYSNCRECGFVLWSRNGAGMCMFMAFFEHRNSDTICCVKWEGDPDISGGYTTANIPHEAYPSKYGVTKEWPYMDIVSVIDWTIEQVTKHHGLNG